MPIRAPQICGCGHRVPSGTRCACQRQRDAERKARHDANRPSARQRGYDAQWQQARAAYLQANPNCRRCGNPASVVDHIEPHKGNTRLFWNRANWQPLCAGCHNRAKQSEERTSFKKREEFIGKHAPGDGDGASCFQVDRPPDDRSRSRATARRHDVGAISCIRFWIRVARTDSVQNQRLLQLPILGDLVLRDWHPNEFETPQKLLPLLMRFIATSENLGSCAHYFIDRYYPQFREAPLEAGDEVNVRRLLETFNRFILKLPQKDIVATIFRHAHRSDELRTELKSNVNPFPVKRSSILNTDGHRSLKMVAHLHAVRPPILRGRT